jgi:hypothetical protein
MKQNTSATRILISWVTVLFTVALPGLAQGATTKEDLGTVTLRVIDEYGHTQIYRVVSFIDIYRKRDLVQRFSGLQGTEIPYGFYDYRLRPSNSPLGDEIPGRVTVNRPESLFVISLTEPLIHGVAVDRATPHDFVILGRLEPMPPIAPSLEPIRVRLSPIHGREHLDLEVDHSGEFRIYKRMVGRYVLSVIRGTEVIHIQLMSFEQSRLPLSFVIKLVDKDPIVQYVR